MIDLIEKKNAFLNEIKVFKAYDTYIFYKIKLNKFINFLINNDYDLNKQNILNFIKHLKKTNINSTINKYIIIINKFLKFLNINIKLDTLTNDSERFINLSDKDFKKLKVVLKDYNLKYRLIVKLFIDTGLRLRELLKIKINNIELSQNRIYLKETKTKKPRYIYFSSYVKKDLKDYLKSVNTEYIFQGSTNSLIYYIFKKIKKDTKIKKISPHILRHTFATNLLYCDLPLYTLQQLLGHKSIHTTEIYIHTNNNQIKKDYIKSIKKYYK